MTIWLYCICRNERLIMPYFLRHYTPWVDKLIFYDDQSDDGTRDLIAACPKAELRDWPGDHGIVDDQFADLANSQWREAIGKGDWVIWVDSDEFIYHPHILEVLQECFDKGIDYPHIDGFTMVSDHFPTTQGQIYDEIKTGFADNYWSKQAVFRSHIRWNVGRHSCDPVPRHDGAPKVKLLHYRCLGMEYLTQRHLRNWERVPERCRAMSYGVNCDPEHQGHHGISWFAEMSKLKLPEVI